MSTPAASNGCCDSSGWTPSGCAAPDSAAPDCIASGCAESVPGSETVDEAAAAALAATLKVLADPVRLRLLSVLATSPTGEVCACDLVEPLGRSQPTISYHLKALREAGLVHARRRGTWIWYSVKGETVEATVRALQVVTIPAGRVPCCGAVLIP